MVEPDPFCIERASLMKMGQKLFFVLITVLSVLVFHTGNPLAQENERPMTLQVMLGEMVITNDDPQVDGGDYNITLFGAAAQAPFFGRAAQAGIETGLLLNWKSETRAVAASGGGGGGTLAVAVDINQFLFDYFFGGYVSLQPIKWLRLYIGAGPLLIYGARETEETDPDTSQTEKTSDSGLGVGVYGRTGIDLIFADKFMLGAGVRATQTTLSFNDPAGKLDVEGWQYFGVLSFRF